MDPPATAIEIVLAEDNLGDVRLICEALKEYRIRGSLVVFTDGEMAIEYLDAIDAQLGSVPALFIIDLNLSDGSGFDLVSEIRTGGPMVQRAVRVRTRRHRRHP